MNINKDNYEAYFLDYFEGNLSPQEIEEVYTFLELHPEVKIEFEGFEMVSVSPDPGILFEEKHALKKNGIVTSPLISSENIDEFLIAELEGTLSANETRLLSEFMASNPHFEKDRRIYASTRLSADPSIQFPEKESLIHKAIPFGAINESNYEAFMIGDLEASLSADEKNELLQFTLVNPQLSSEQKLFSLTRLQPDLSIVFEHKATLKHAIVPIRRIVLYSLSAAASIALLFGAYFLLNNNTGLPSLAKEGKVNASAAVSQGSSSNSVHESKNNLLSLSKNTHVVPTTPDDRKPLILPGSKSTKTDYQTGSFARNSSVIPSMSPLACKEISSRDYVKPEFMFIRASQMHRNEYMELYYNVRLAEQIQYAQLNESDQNPERTIFTSVAAKVINLVNPKPTETPETKPNLSVWTFAELGVKTYNSIAQDNVQLELQRDDQGKVIAYNLVGDNLDLQRNVKK